MENKKVSIKYYILLNAIILLYSLGGILTKTASKYELFSFEFLIFYGMSMMNLVLYAFFWQIILKKIPLTAAYTFKSLTIVWSILWGALFFGEIISLNKIMGVGIILLGVFFMVKSDE